MNLPCVEGASLSLDSWGWLLSSLWTCGGGAAFFLLLYFLVFPVNRYNVSEWHNSKAIIATEEFTLYYSVFFSIIRTSFKVPFCRLKVIPWGFNSIMIGLFVSVTVYNQCQCPFPTCGCRLRRLNYIRFTFSGFINSRWQWNEEARFLITGCTVLIIICWWISNCRGFCNINGKEWITSLKALNWLQYLFWSKLPCGSSSEDSLPLQPFLRCFIRK